MIVDMMDKWYLSWYYC